MRNFIKVALLICLSFEIGYCEEDYQIRVSTYIDSISYRLDENDIEIGKKVDFRFPPLEKRDPYLLQCIQARGFEENNEHNEKQKFYGCLFEFTNGKSLDGLTDKRIKIKCYSQNIDTLDVAVQMNLLNNMWFTISRYCPKKERLYHNFNIELLKISKTIITSLPQIESANPDSLRITGLKIFTKKKENQRLIIGDLKFYSKKKISARTHEDFYRELVYRNIQLYYNNRKFQTSDSKYVEKKLSLFEDSGIEFLLYGIQTELFIPSEIDSAAENVKENLKVNYVSGYVRKILTEYFQNTANDNDFIISQYDSLVQSSTSLDEFYHDLEELLYRIEDTHFRLINEKSRRYSSLAPIYFYKILKKIQVVAILDTTLLDRVTLGDVLTKVNNKPVEAYIKKLDATTTGTNFHSRERKIIQKLLHNLYRAVNDTLHLTFESSIGGTYTIQLPRNKIFRNRCLSIPANIQEKRKRYDYKKVGDYAYLKVGHFVESQLRSFMYTYIDSIMNSKGIVIDFRNNYAGDFSLAFLLSFFIDKPAILFTDSKADNNYETILINPDPFYHYSAPMVILFDSRTTCASEFFINALRSIRKDVVTIATSQSGGAGQRASYLILPSTDKFRGTLLYRANVMYDSQGGNIDLEGGIKPMIWTYFKSYLDLAPYDDKLLNKAIQYLETYNINY